MRCGLGPFACRRWGYLEGFGFSVLAPEQHFPQQAPQAQAIEAPPSGFDATLSRVRMAARTSIETCRTADRTVVGSSATPRDTASGPAAIPCESRGGGYSKRAAATSLKG
jgi:hypothetical protein